MARDEPYRNAEQKIKAARRSGAKELDLSVPWGDEKTPKLTEFPESLGQLTQLQSLNLSDNQLTALPESLGQLTQLQSLNLTSNQLTALPESLVLPLRAAQRELARLAAVGLVEAKRRGHQVFFTVDTGHPLFAGLRSLLDNRDIGFVNSLADAEPPIFCNTL